VSKAVGGREGWREGRGELVSKAEEASASKTVEAPVSKVVEALVSKAVETCVSKTLREEVLAGGPANSG